MKLRHTKADDRIIDDIGRRIMYYRRVAGMTQKDLDIHSGLGQSMICRYEQGGTDISITALFAIAIALEIDIDLLIREHDLSA